MKLEINNIAVPYKGGCTVEKNYPFFEEGGLENSFSYTFSVPICPITHNVFGNIERLNSRLPLATYKVRLSHEEITYVTGNARLSGANDKDIKLNLTDEGNSIYGALSDLKLTDLDVAKFTFNNYDEYLAFAKGKTFDNMLTNELHYPLIHCPDFYNNVKGEGDAFESAMAVWDANPLLNHWHGLTESAQANTVPDTVLFPVIPSTYILKKICEKLGIEQMSNSEMYNVVISSYFRGRTPLDVFDSGAYREENGIITVDVADFLPPITALEYFQSIMGNANLYRPDRFNIKRKAHLLLDPQPGIDITPYVIEDSVNQIFLKEKDGWEVECCGEILTSGNGELNIPLSAENVSQVQYRIPDDGKKLIGSIGLTLGDKNSYKNVFPLLGGYAHGVVVIRNMNNTDLINGWQEYLNWEVKEKRQITLKCTPHEDQFISILRLGLCMYKNVSFLIKQIRFEMLENRLGVVTYVLVQR